MSLRAAGADRAGGADRPTRTPGQQTRSNTRRRGRPPPAGRLRRTSQGETMSTPTSPPVNGRARKSLEHQLDRLDAILDGLADALDGAVADAVREGVGRAVKEAVQVVVAELLTNPDVAKKLAEAHGLTRPPAAPPEPPAPAGPTWRERLAARLRRVRAAAAAAKDRAVAAVAGRLNTARTILTCAVRLARAERRGVTFGG